MAEKVIGQLQALGLLKNEVEVYLLLARAGTCPVGAIARRLATNRMSIYRTLKALEKKGLVESTLERPSKFVALPVSGFLDRCIEEYKTKMASLVESKTEIVELLAHLQETVPQVEEPRFRIVQGRRQIFDQIFKMLARAKSEICIIQTQNGLYRFIYGGIDDRLRKLHNVGAEVMILTHIDESTVEAVKNFTGFAQVRHATLPSMLRLLLVDDAEALTTFSTDDSMSLTTEKDLAMWVKAPDYVKNLRVFFEALWKEAALAGPRLVAVEARQRLVESLNAARRTLDASGWTTLTPGKLTGESGVNHVFDLVATYPGDRKTSIVIDLLSEHGSSQILAFSLKALDVNPTLQLILTSKAPNGEESELASRRGIKIVYAEKNPTIAEKVSAEARRILRQR